MKLIIMHIAFSFALFLISCNNNNATSKLKSTEAEIKIKETLKITSNQSDTNVIIFNLRNFNKIDNYKTLDFENRKLLLDNYLSNVDKSQFKLAFSKNLKKTNSDTNTTFFVETDYGKVKFESVKDGDAFHEYHYLNDIQLPSFRIIKMYTIDYPVTIFLNIKKYSGFTTDGEISFSKSKDFFVSISNTPDYCLFEIYKISNENIINIVNLYSNHYQIDNISWDNDLLFETVLSKGERYYCKIDFQKILSDFE